MMCTYMHMSILCTYCQSRTLMCKTDAQIHVIIFICGCWSVCSLARIHSSYPALCFCLCAIRSQSADARMSFRLPGLSRCQAWPSGGEVLSSSAQQLSLATKVSGTISQKHPGEAGGGAADGGLGSDTLIT